MRNDWHKQFNVNERIICTSYGTYMNRPTKNPIVLLCAYIMKLMGYKSTIVKTKPEACFYIRYYYQD
jgi:hypothetical protein